MIWLVRGEILLHPHIKLGDVLKSQFSAPQITSLLQTCFGNSTLSPLSLSKNDNRSHEIQFSFGLRETT